MRSRREREDLVARYLSALGRGDFEGVAAVLAEAEADALLEEMVLGVNEALAGEEGPAPAVDAAALIRRAVHAPGSGVRTVSEAVPGPDAPPDGRVRATSARPVPAGLPAEPAGQAANPQSAIRNPQSAPVRAGLQTEPGVPTRSGARQQQDVEAGPQHGRPRSPFPSLRSLWIGTLSRITHHASRITQHASRTQWLRGGAWATAAALFFFSLYVAGIEDFIGKRQTLVLGQQTLAWASPASFRVVALRDAERRVPLGNTPVRVRARTRTGSQWHSLYEGKTNASGTVDALFRLPDDLQGECVLNVETGAGRQRDRVERTITVERKAKVLLTTDKPLYQPGQTIHMRVLAMYTGARRPAAEEPLTLEVKDPKGTRVFRKECRTSRWGIASADLELADPVNQGRYQVVARFGEDETEKTVTVKPYVLPKFRVDARPERTYYAPGQVMSGRVKAAYFFGKAVSGGKVSVELAAYDTEFHRFARIEGRTDAQGLFSFTARLPESFAGHPLERGDALVRLTAEVTDRAGHQERVVEAVPVAARPFRLALVPESGEPAWGLENVFYVVASYPDGTPARVQGTVTGRAEAIHLNTDGSPGGPDPGSPVTLSFSTDETGIAEVALPVGKDGISLSLTARDRAGRAAGPIVRDFRRPQSGIDDMGDWTRRYMGFRGAGAEDSVLLRPDRAIYQVGEAANLDVFARSRTGTLYLDVAREGQTLLTRSGDIRDGRCRFALDLSDDMAGVLTLHAYYLTPELGMVRDTRRIVVRPGEELKVAVQPSAESYRPGEEARLRVSLTDAQGQGVPGAIGLRVVDESVYALRETDVALERDYFAMEKAILEPRYQEKFGLPETLYPGAVLYGPAAQRRAAVSLACLPGPKNFRMERTESMARYAADLEMNVDFGDTDYGLWAESLPERLAQAREYRDRYFGRLYFAWVAAAILVPLFSFTRAGWAGGCLLFPWMLLVLGMLGVSSWEREFGFILGLFAFGLAAVARWARHSAVVVAVCLPALFLAVAVTTPMLLRAQKSGKESAAMQVLRSMRSAEEAHKQQTASVQAGLSDTGGRPAPPRLREYFPETLFWQPEVIADENGTAEVTLPGADSITTWHLSALASTLDGRIGSAARGIRVFQEFFIDPDLPAALTQNDWISVPVAVHNYLPRAQKVRVTLKEEDWFVLSGEATREVSLAPNDVGVVRFPITARLFGKHALEFTGQSGSVGDAIRREVEVLPDGAPRETAFSDRLSGRLEHTVRFPAGTLPGTGRVWLKLHPGVFSQVVEGLDGLLQVPYGCFEQTSSITYPNILILDYLKRTRKATPEVQMKAEQLINLGYQRILTFETPGGGFDWFGRPPAKTILTAYGLMELHDMAKVATVDPALIERARQVLLKRQQPDGSWVVDREMHTWSGVEDRLALTAFATWALAYAADGSSAGAVNQGLAYLESHIDGRTDPYVLALSANAFAAGRPRGSDTGRLLDLLDGGKQGDSKAAFWAARTRTLTSGGADAGSEETTALAAQGFLRGQRHTDTATRALTYLTRCRGPHGAWCTTQSTILSLQALLTASEGLVERGKGTIRVQVDGRDAGALQIDEANSDVMQQLDLTPLVGAQGGRVSVSIEGNMEPMVQFVAKSYVGWESARRGDAGRGRRVAGAGFASGRSGGRSSGGVAIQVAYDRTALAQNDTLTARVSIRSRAKETLSMLIADVGLAPGFVPDGESLNALVAAERIERYEVTPRQLILYLRDLAPGKTLLLPVRLRARFPVRAVVPPSTVYEYYNPANRATTRPARVVVRDV